MLRRAAIVTVVCVLSFCFLHEQAQAGEGKLVIGLIPEVNLLKQMERYKPLVDYLGKKTGMEVSVKPLSNYGRIYEELRDGKIDGGFFGSFVCGMTRARIGIVPLARPVRLDGVSTYMGYTFVRKDSGIKTPADMKGRTMALVDPATTAGYLAQRLYFQKYGVNIDKDVRILWAGSHDEAIAAVVNKHADMGGAKDLQFKKVVSANPSLKETLLVLDESPAVPDNALAVRNDLDAGVREKMKKALLGMDSDPQGQEVLKTFGAKKFIETRDEDYKSLYEMAKKAGIDLKTYPYQR